MAEQRLQKIIARAGVTSRRKAEDLILAGRVRVNGEVVDELGATADPARDTVSLDGRPLVPEPLRYLAVHKPAGVLTAVSDPRGRTVVNDLLEGRVEERVFPAGRLDLDSEGLVLLTNDGPLMEAVTRPGGGVGKRYEAWVEGRPSDDDVERLAAGIELDGRPTLPCTIRLLDEGPPAHLEIVLHEGRKNQIRRMFQAVGNPVVRLVRHAIGPLQLGGLDAGAWRDLDDDEVAALRRAAGLGGRLRIAIDGPSGSGKSTLGQALARRLGLPYVDTGAMYRAVAWKAMRLGHRDAASVEAMLDDTVLEVEPDADGFGIIVDGHEVPAELLRTPEVGRKASEVAAMPVVRRWLLPRQRALARGGVVMEGRDIGTVVLPGADCKFFVTSDEAIRTARRAAQLGSGRPDEADDDVRARDRRDRARSISPLEGPAPGAVVVDTGDRSVEESVHEMLAALPGRPPR